MDFSSPNLVPILNIVGFGVLAILAAAGKWYGERRERTPPPTKDVVVNSLTVADSAIIADAAATLRESNRLIHARQNFEHEMLIETKRTNEYLEDIKHILKRPQRQEAID